MERAAIDLFELFAFDGEPEVVLGVERRFVAAPCDVITLCVRARPTEDSTIRKVSSLGDLRSLSLRRIRRREEMSAALPLKVPVRVDVAWGDNWLMAKE